MKMKWYKYILLFILSLSSCKEKSTEPTVESVPSNFVIAYDTPGEGNIYLYNSLTKSLVNVTSNVVDTFYYAYVSSFSNDGHELLFTLDYRKKGNEDLLFCDRDDIYSYNLITGQTIRITDTEFRETNPKYSKDKKTIVYQSFEKGYSEIYIIKQDSDNKEPVFIDVGWYPTFLYDDNQILYSSNPNCSPGLYLYNLKDRTKEKLINIDGTDPSVSNNNQIIVFQGSDGIYKYDFSTKSITLILSGNSGVKMNYNPIVSNDSKYIVYQYFDGSWSYNRVMTIDGNFIIDLGKGFAADFTKDSKNVVSLQTDGMHLYNIYSQRDSVLLPYQILSFDLVVSSIK